MEQEESRVKQWIALVSVTLSCFILVTCEFLPAGILNEITQSFNISFGTAGLIITITAIGAAIFAPIITVLSGNLDRKFILLASSALMLVGNFIVIFAPSFEILLIGRLIIGACLGSFWAIAMVVSVKLAPSGVSVSKTSTILMSGATLATVLGLPLGAWLSHVFSWQIAFIIINVIGVIVLLLQFWSIPSLKQHTVVHFKDISSLLFNPNTSLGLLSVFLLGLAHFGAFSYISVFLNGGALISPSYIASLLLLFGVAGIFGNVFGGYVSGKNTHITFLLVSASIAISFILLIIFAKIFILLSSLIFIWGFTFAILPVWVNVWVFETAPDNLSGAMPLVITIFQLMFILSSFFGGLVVDNAGISVLFIVATCLAGIACITKVISQRRINNLGLSPEKLSECT